MTYGNLCKPYPETIAELERKLEITRQQYMDADHAFRLVKISRERLLKENDEMRRTIANYAEGVPVLANHIAARETDMAALTNEVGTLRFEATQLMAENSNHILAIDSLRVERAWLKQNAKHQADRIRELETGLQPHRLQAAVYHAMTSGPEPITQQDPPPTRELETERARVVTRADVDAIPRLTGGELKAAREIITQHDLPATRAEEQATD